MSSREHPGPHGIITTQDATGCHLLFERYPMDPWLLHPKLSWHGKHAIGRVSHAR